MKIINTLIFLIIFCNIAKAQKFFATTFNSLPQNYQLYPRNDSNEALVPISGKIEEAGWNYFSVQIFRNKQLIGYQKAPISYKNTVGNFSFQSVKIKAEKAEYDFKIFAVRDKDSLNVINRENIVSGDVYIVSGQSNSTAFFNDPRTNEYCRTFGKITGNFNVDNGNPADTLWALANQDQFFQGVGAMGFEIQKIILEKTGIPTCLINGGFNWSSMKQHATRTANNPTDLTNGYGRMLYRLQKAGIAQAVKALIFRQGETEAYGEGTDWAGNFDTYYKNLKVDLPSIQKIYLFQIDIIFPARSITAPQVRELQRVINEKYSDVIPFSTVGTISFDGLHYNPEGYQQNGQELAPLILRDFYKSTDLDNITPPTVRRVYYSNKDNSEITVQFDQGQELTWTEQTRNLLMKNQFFLDGISGLISGGSVVNSNQVILKLITPVPLKTLSYLPPFIDNKSADFPYTGPFIKNKRGLRAFSFYEMKIDPYVPPLKTTISQAPQNLQLFPRNDKNEANVAFTGKVETANYNSVSMIVTRNNAIIKYYKTPLTYANGLANFTFNHTIKAELAQYSFKIYATQGTDSLLVISRDNIVSGDVFVINGQSNGAAWGVSNNFPNYDYKNEYCRTFGQTQSGKSFITQADTTWAYSNTRSPYVGVWGIELQKIITEKYGIPTCILNEALSGSAITEHTVRDAVNPTNVNNIYGRLLYRATKAGVLNNIKGFFFWQGEAEAFANPTIWQGEFDKLYNFWKTDYPAVGKFYIFQVNILGVPLPEAADLRNFQRKIKQLYAKTEVIGTIGNSGYDGAHYTVDGYKRFANEAFRLVARDFYGSADTSQITSPNVQRAYYTNLAKDEIAIFFENNHSMIWTADSTYRQDDGNLKKYFMKDYIYLNATDKVLSGRAEGNKIIIKTSGFTGSQSVTYLPAFYPQSYPVDLRGIFGGPFLKNQRGMNAFSFTKQSILDPINSPTLSVKIQTAIAIQLTWKEITNAAYQLEVKDLASEKYTILQKFPKGTTTFLVDNLLGSTNYTFRIKAIMPDNLESEYSVIQAQTPKALDAVSLQSESTYIDIVKLKWKAVADAVNYVVERKNITTNAFEQIVKVANTVLEFTDNVLKDNTLYEYRVKAVGAFTESPYTNISQKTIAKLASPELTMSVLFYNSLKIDWKPVPNAFSYVLERKAPGQDFKEWGTFEPKVLSFTDKDLTQNTTYSYRIKAFGDKTESSFTTIDGKTTPILATPEMTVVPTSYDALKVLWKAVPNVTQYILERRILDSDPFVEIAKLDASKTEYADVSLKEKTNYTYRMKAYGDRTESDFVSVKAQTTAILAIEQEVLDGVNLFPNPTHTQVTIRFAQPMSGTLTITDLRGVKYFQEEIKKVTEKEIPLTHYQKGVYFVSLRGLEGVFVRKLVVGD
jgi:Carbohydrate esterase, sialic acid-specific acetylesterase/Secretion system C-terminal sorting domain